MLTGLEGYDVEKRQVHLFKFSSDGTADKYFGKTGWSMRLFYTHRYSLGYFVKTFITGSTNNQVLLGVSLGFGDTTFIRINQDGSIDRTFADDGMKSFASNFYISDGDKLSGSKQNHIGVRTSALKTDAGKTYHAINSVQGVWYINIDGDLLGDIDLKNYSADVFSEFEEDKFHFRTEFATDIVNGEQFVIAEVKRKNVEYDKSLMIFKLKDKAIDLTFGTKGVFWIKGDVNYFFGGNAEYAKDGGLLFTYKGKIQETHTSAICRQLEYKHLLPNPLRLIQTYTILIIYTVKVILYPLNHLVMEEDSFIPIINVFLCSI
ncbi:hypothetical protein [Psychrosphaera algicola]|uniref:Uncharacterized protein n=1 Tax=Psychrosphaera algicola TaxID=3023714 RepID=A0ABT5FCM5_9GAMM|nr:hypothetical protein [Psychrosphaera sp. G1-22]MDC2888598.1 hypothetical protein [Psychrosphaera sp. G1-22]